MVRSPLNEGNLPNAHTRPKGSSCVDEWLPSVVVSVELHYVRSLHLHCNLRSYDLFKSWFLRHRVPVVDYQFRDNLGLHMVASTLAGTVATSEFFLHGASLAS